MARIFLLTIVYSATAFILSAGVNWMAAISWRRAQSAHWTERARLLWPARQTAAANQVVLPLFFGFLQSCFEDGFSWGIAVAALSSWVGSILGSYWLVREYWPELKLGPWLKFVTLTWSSFLLYLVSWVGGGAFMPDELDSKSCLIVAGVLGISLAWSVGGSRRWLEVVKALRPADERLRRIVASEAQRMSVRPPAARLLDVPLANAVAWPLTGEVWFTTKLMEICSDEEVGGICAHELAHLSESKGVLLLRVIGSWVFLPLLFVRPAIHAMGLVGALVPGGGVFALSRLRVGLGRRMEKRADSLAAQAQPEERTYALTLEKLYRENGLPAVLGRGKVHPHLYDRMVAAGVQPDFARPKVPESISWIFIVLSVAMGVLGGLAAAGRLDLLHRWLGQGP